MSERLAFQIEPNDPMRVTVTAPDGKRYPVKLRLGLIEVKPTGRMLHGGGNIPTFEFKTQLVVDYESALEDPR
jgi:hypothetical protein